jgi:hypothetical protein
MLTRSCLPTATGSRMPSSLIEIGASSMVIWELSGTGEARQRRGLRLIGYGFASLAVDQLVQSTAVLAAGYHPRHSRTGILWTAATALMMFALAAGKARTGHELGNPVLHRPRAGQPWSTGSWPPLCWPAWC